MTIHKPKNSPSESSGRVWGRESPGLTPAELASLPKRGYNDAIGRAASIVILLALVGGVINFATRPAVDWVTTAENLFNPIVLSGIQNTLTMTFWSLVLNIVLAVCLANMALSRFKLLKFVAAFYVWLFRSIPILVLLVIAFNIALIYPTIALNIPGIGQLFEISTSQYVNAYWAAVLAFGIHQAAYTSEVLRAAQLAIPKGQLEAAMALGLPRTQRFLRIELPQAVKIAIPPLGNDTIGLLKGTAMAAFVAVPDLLYAVQGIYNRTYEVMPLLMVATVWYIVFVGVLTLIQYGIERRLSPKKAVRLVPPQTDLT